MDMIETVLTTHMESGGTKLHIKRHFMCENKTIKITVLIYKKIARYMYIYVLYIYIYTSKSKHTKNIIYYVNPQTKLNV